MACESSLPTSYSEESGGEREREKHPYTRTHCPFDKRLYPGFIGFNAKCQNL